MSRPADQRSGRSGRRPGDSGTREAILAAARRRFAAHGYARASLRGIAADAGVDQKLIAHFFGAKQQLFLEAIGLPLNPAEILRQVLADGDPSAITERLAVVITGILERPEIAQSIAALIRAAATESDIDDLLRQYFPGELLKTLHGRLGPGDPGLRLNLFGSQIVGLIMTHQVIAVEPLASTSSRVIAEAVSPTLTRYLIGPLDANHIQHD